MTAANDFLMAGGVTSAKFPAPGHVLTGTIVREPEVQQQTDMATGTPKFWDDGKPRQQLQVQLATAERDPAEIGDDGVRAIYVKGNMLKAVREAVKKSGAPGLQVGGTLTVTYIGDGEAKRGFSAPKLYSAVYAPAPSAAANTFLNSAEQTAPAAPAASAPAPAPASTEPVPAGVSPEAIAALAKLSPEQKAALGL